MNASSSARPHRRWLSLPTGRWHASSRMVMALLSLSLIFCNLPGQAVERMRYKVGFPFYAESLFEHGWPFTYLIRAAPAKISVRNCFELWCDCKGFQLGPLLANSCVVLLVTLAVGVAFEIWRRQRSRLWHLHLRDLFAATLAVSLTAAWYAHGQRMYAVEYAMNEDVGNSLRSQQEGGITWLRTCLGEESFGFLDRTFEVSVDEPAGWSHLDRLTSVHHVEAQVRATTEELGHLAKMPQLEALSLHEFQTPPGSDYIIAELPPLPRLRGLYLSQPAYRCRRIDRLSSLEALRIGMECIDEQVLREISDLPNLRELALDGLPESADLSFLPTRRRLAALNLYHGHVSRAVLKSIGDCQDLKELSFKMSVVDGSGIRHLASLAQLEILSLEHTNVTSEDLASLGSLKRLREFDLTHTNINGDLHFMSSLECLESLTLYNTKVTSEDLAALAGLAHLRSLDLGYASIGTNGREQLRQLKQLKWLRVSNFDTVELDALRRALPECQIQRH